MTHSLIRVYTASHSISNPNAAGKRRPGNESPTRNYATHFIQSTACFHQCRKMNLCQLPIPKHRRTCLSGKRQHLVNSFTCMGSIPILVLACSGGMPSHGLSKKARSGSHRSRFTKGHSFSDQCANCCTGEPCLGIMLYRLALIRLPNLLTITILSDRRRFLEKWESAGLRRICVVHKFSPLLFCQSQFFQEQWLPLWHGKFRKPLPVFRWHFPCRVAQS